MNSAMPRLNSCAYTGTDFVFAVAYSGSGEN
jgi:hypothetical protein